MTGSITQGVVIKEERLGTWWGSRKFQQVGWNSVNTVMKGFRSLQLVIWNDCTSPASSWTAANT